MSEGPVTCREGCLRVAGDMNIYVAADIKQHLFALAPDCGRDIELDLSQVTALDTAGVQLLLMLRRMANSNGAGFRLREPSPIVTEVLELCGLQHLVATTAMERLP